MEQFLYADTASGLTQRQIREALLTSLEGRKLRRGLIVPPDFTRYHSGAGLITGVYYHALTERGTQVGILPALGTHQPMTAEQARIMFGDIPYSRFIPHNWRTGVVRLGEVPGSWLAELTGGLWTEPISVELNRRILDPGYDLIISTGQVVPHEVAGMSGHAKNLLIGAGGSDMINKSHMMGAVYGMERIMGRDRTPVRRLFDDSMERFLARRPILFVLTVAAGGRTHGLFIGEGRGCFTAAAALSQKKNITFVEHSLKKCVVYLEPGKYKSTWLGNKAIYRTRMAMADGGELIILAPGVTTFGEDPTVDALIRKYGYRGRLPTLEAFRSPSGRDLRDNMGAAAHLIHGSSDGRFSIRYAVEGSFREEIARAGFLAAGYRDLAAQYDPQALRYGWNRVDGEEVYFIPDPGTGLWVGRERF